jgi:hypothetical protein
MTEPETPPPVGTPSAVATASQPLPEHRVMALEAAAFSYTAGSAALLLTLASQNLLAHARTLAARTEDEFHQMAVVFAHAACELHTEWGINQLLNARADKTLVALVLPADRDVSSLDNRRIRRVYSALTGDNPKEADWWAEWLASRQDRHEVAHRGAQVTLAQAEAADRYMKHVTEKVEAAPRPGQ